MTEQNNYISLIIIYNYLSCGHYQLIICHGKLASQHVEAQFCRWVVTLFQEVNGNQLTDLKLPHSFGSETGDDDHAINKFYGNK